MNRMQGKVALVTGAGRGQGRAHAALLAEEGADIIAVDICGPVETIPYAMATEDDLAVTAELVEKHDRRVITRVADIRDQSALDAVVAAGIAEFGYIDVLIATAGVYSLGKAWEIDETSWTTMVDVILGGAWRTAKAVIPHMIERQSGSIVMTASINGLEAGPNYAHYTAAKHGVLGLMKTMAVELGEHNVRCNAICPAAIDTPLNDWQECWNMMAGHENGTHEDRGFSAYHYHQLRGRGLLTPESVARAALFLASDDSADVTGLALPVDAGHMVMPGFNPSPVRS